MATGASSSNAIAPAQHKYDAFFSFRGEDTRYGFVSHLYAAFCRKKIKTYIDDSLERGHEISISLMQAIQESKVSIVIFSENYASSSWCLDELVHILHCKERYKQIVIPVFYHVEPAHIRKQKGNFGKAFSLLEERFKGAPEKVNKWRTALSTTADISGRDSSGVRFEAELVEKIVEDAVRKLNRMSRLSHEFKGFVGIERRIKKIESLLRMNENGVRIIGLWGMGGIGKTTLATIVFNKFSSEFEGCCFVANVREEWDRGLKNYLQNKLVSELLEEENPYNVRNRLCNRKVFIVLDDVNDQEQLEHLIGDCRCFGQGSRIIVTTRDLQMLRYIEADAIYKVEELDRYEALELFLSNAFKGNFPATEYVKMSERVVSYAEGIPLALKVMGTLLRCREKEIWESALNELIEQAANEKIHNVLNLSYDGLHEKDRHLFLDIACFFNGRDRCYVEEILSTNSFFSKTGVDNLIEKSLVTIRDSNTLWIHGLVQKMGWKVILSTKQPGKRSRLWIAQDVIHVLKNKTGTEEIQGIFLDTYHIEKVHLGPVVFEEMHNLRFLKIVDWEWDNRLRYWDTKLHFPRGLKSLPLGLIYLEWHNYPLRSLPYNFTPHNLVELLMPNSKLEKLWNGVQHLGNLKHIDLSFSNHLTQLPDLSHAPKLQSINLAFCRSLVQLPPLNFQTFDKHLDLGNPWPFVFKRNPGTLNLIGCSSLKSLPRISGKLQYLNLDDTAVEELPTSIWSLDNLILLGLDGCKMSKNLPISIHKLKRLRYLSISNCLSLDKVPGTLPRSIVVLNLSGTAIEQVPPSIKYVSCLEEFRLSNCKRLVHLSNRICKLKSLKHLDLCGCSKLKKFPKLWERMGSLRTLDLRKTGIIELPHSIEKMTGLHDLLLDSCGDIELFPNSVVRLTSIRKLSLANCALFEIPDWLSCFCSLELLDLRGNLIERLPPSIEDLSRLIELQIENCKNLQSLPELPLSLGLLDASGCTSLKTVSNSKSALAQGCWNDYQVTHYKEFLFSNCSKLDGSARNNIIFDSQIRILRTAAISISRSEELSHLFQDKPHVSICYPGNEIPKWFNYQSENPSVTIELPLHWHKNFICFALCAVVNSEDCDFEWEPFEIKCKLYFETNRGKSRKFHFEFQENWANQSDLRSCITVVKSSDHVFMWHKHEDYHDCLDAVKASFDFQTLLCKFYNSMHRYNSSKVKVRRCGIRLLYLQETEDFGIVDNAKPNGNASIDCEQTT